MNQRSRVLRLGGLAAAIVLAVVVALIWASGSGTVSRSSSSKVSVLKPAPATTSTTAPSSSDLGPAVIDEIAKNLPGATVALAILRGGAQRVVNIKLSSRSGQYFNTTTAPEAGFLGVSVATQGAQSTTPAGAVVVQVEADSPAEAAGLVQGDVITSIGSTSIASTQDLSDTVLPLAPGTAVQVAYNDPEGGAHATNVTVGSYPSGLPAPNVVSV